MKNRNTFTASLLTLLAVGLLVPAAQAGLISINSTTLSSSGAEIGGGAVTPEVVFAWNTYGTLGGTPTFNGITFYDAQPASLAQTFISGGGGGQSDPDNPPHYTDQALKDVMLSYMVSAYHVNATVTISDLVVGQQYRVQFLHHSDNNDSSTRQFHVTFGIGGTSGGVVNVGDNVGAITTVDFTADSSSQVFQFVYNGYRSVLNAAILYTVPTPAALPAGLGLLALTALRRKRRA